MDGKIKFAVVFHNISDTHLTKDPLLIPITMMQLGVDSVVFAYKNEVTQTEGVPRIVTINTYPTVPSKGGIFAYLRYAAQELGYARALMREVGRERPDGMLFYYDPIAVWMVRLFNPRVKIAYKLDIGDAADLEKYPYPKIMLKLALWMKAAAADILITETQLGYNGVIKFAPFTRKKLRLIRNGIAKGFFLKPGEKPVRKNIILSVARINRVKGLDALIKGFSKVYGKHKDWKVRIIGPVEDAQYYEELKALVGASSLGKNVEFVTTFLPEEEHRKEFLRASIFCLSSIKEGAPAARVEAMAMGVPIVTTETGGSELVQGSGMVVNVGDIDAIASALDEFMSSKAKRDEASGKELEAAKAMSAENSANQVLKEMGLR